MEVFRWKFYRQCLRKHQTNSKISIYPVYFETCKKASMPPSAKAAIQGRIAIALLMAFKPQMRLFLHTALKRVSPDGAPSVACNVSMNSWGACELRIQINEDGLWMIGVKFYGKTANLLRVSSNNHGQREGEESQSWRRHIIEKLNQVQDAVVGRTLESKPIWLAVFLELFVMSRANQRIKDGHIILLKNQKRYRPRG